MLVCEFPAGSEFHSVLVVSIPSVTIKVQSVLVVISIHKLRPPNYRVFFLRKATQNIFLITVHSILTYLFLGGGELDHCFTVIPLRGCDNINFPTRRRRVYGSLFHCYFESGCLHCYTFVRL